MTTVVTPETRTTIQVAVIIAVFSCSTAITCTWWLSNRFAAIERHFAAVEATIAVLTESVADTAQDRFTLTAASEQALRWAIENPQLHVPDPRDPSRIITVRDGVSSVKGDIP